jgi:hypothetical protein
MSLRIPQHGAGKVAETRGPRGRRNMLDVSGEWVLPGTKRMRDLHFGDLRLRIGRALAHPVGVGQRLALAFPVQANKVLGRGRLDAAFGGHAVQHVSIGLARVPAHDRPQRRVGLHGRGVHPDLIALHQTVLRNQRKHPAEDLFMDFMRKAAPRLRQPRVVGTRAVASRRRKVPQRKRVRAAPLDPAFGIDALEVADHVHSEVPPRRDRRHPHLCRIIRLARPLGESVEAGLEAIPPAADRKRHAQVIAASPATSPPDHLASRLPTQRHPAYPPNP